MKQGNQEQLDPNKKWNQAWATGLKDKEYWDKEFKEPAQAIALKLKNPIDAMSGDVITAKSRTDHVATASADSSLYREVVDIRDADNLGPGPGKRIRGAKATWPATTAQTQNRSQPYLQQDGLYITNKDGMSICSGFSLGTCPNRGRCPRNEGSHQCDRCLRSDHAGHEHDRVVAMAMGTGKGGWDKSGMNKGAWDKNGSKAGNKGKNKGKDKGKDKNAGKGWNKGWNSWQQGGW